MRQITKGPEPPSLTRWKRANPSGHYGGLGHAERKDIRVSCVREQCHLCAYCCQEVSGDSASSSIEHVEARSRAPQRDLDYGNMVASCTNPNQCDKAHGARHLPLTPLMPECETELRFSPRGGVEGLTARAKEAVKVLNLDSETLIERRKSVCHGLLWGYGINPATGPDDDPEMLEYIIQDLNQPENGKLQSFAPVAASMLSNYLPRRQRV